MKRFISLAMAVLLAAGLLAVGAVPAAADDDAGGCGGTGGPHIYIRFLHVSGNQQYLICENGCGAIYYAAHPISLTSFNNYRHESYNSSYASGDTVKRHIIGYRDRTQLPSRTIEGHNFRYEVLEGEDYVGLNSNIVHSKKNFVKISNNKVAAVCDLGSVAFDIEVRPSLPFQWFVIIFCFGWIWW